MKEIKRILSLLLCICMIGAIICTTLASCGNDEDKDSDKEHESTTETGTAESEKPSESESETTPTESDKPVTPPTQKISYTVNVKSAGGMALSGTTVTVYDSNDNIAGFTKTNDNGQATFQLEAKVGYVAKVTDEYLPIGYTGSPVPFGSGTTVDMVLTSAVVEKDPPATYKLGDIMYDFTFTTYNDNREIKLSDLFKDGKDMVLINYWYDGCAYCLEEFPAMDAIYANFKDSVEILALSPVDTNSDIANFMENYKDALPEGGLSFPVGYDSADVIRKFNPGGAPTSIVVDRYGVICLIVEGAMTEYEFTKIFEYFTGDDYIQKVVEDPNELTPREKPTVEMPSSSDIEAAINTNGIVATYAPETESKDKEYSWPFILADKDGRTTIKASNSKIPNSFATLYVEIEMKAGQALVFDYLSCTENGKDVVHVLIDNRQIYQISGNGGEWKECCPYVAQKDGKYQLVLLYVKNNSVDTGDDTIYIDNMRLIDSSEITEPSYIYRDAVTDKNASGTGFNTYITPVFNENDGYYHVNSVDGPILLANLMGYTQFAPNQTIWIYAYNDKIIVDGKNYKDELEKYSNYSLNGDIYGYCSVNKELKGLLEIVAKAIGTEGADNPNEWLQMCAYYDAYGTGGEQLKDPVKGLATFSAYEAVMGDTNEVTYSKIFMPRGYLFKFVPTVSGVYRITSFSTVDGLTGTSIDPAVEGWIFNSNSEIIYNYEFNEKLWTDPDNVSMVLYMSAGQEYYIDIAYYDVYGTGTFNFEIEHIGDTATIFTLASPAYFTKEDGDDDEAMNSPTIAGGVDVMLGDDGKYYVKNKDGSQGPALYVDFTSTTGLFSQSIEKAVSIGGFNFTKTLLDMEIEEVFDLVREDLGLAADAKLTEAQYKQVFIDLWGEELYETERREIVEDVNNGIYHINVDHTETMKAYIAQMYTYTETGIIPEELDGCLEVTEELAEILQLYMDTYTFEGVDHSWTKLCFYYKTYSASNPY